MECQHCHKPTDMMSTLCPACTLDMTIMILTLYARLDPLRASLDATIHPGGHQPTRTNTATPPTPIRLDVLDLIDLIDAEAAELNIRLRGIDASKHGTPLPLLLLDLAADPGLSMLADAETWHTILDKLCKRTLQVIDAPDPKHAIGNCLNPDCRTLLTAADGERDVSCPRCGSVWRVAAVRLGLLDELASSGKLVTIDEAARLMRTAGYRVQAKRIRNWRDRRVIVPAGVNASNRKVFRLGDIVCAARRFDARKL